MTIKDLDKLRTEAKKQLDSGKSIPEVGSALLKAGYKKEEVDEILKPFIEGNWKLRLAIVLTIWIIFIVLFALWGAYHVSGILIALGVGWLIADMVRQGKSK